MDPDEPLDGVTDTIKPWTLRAMPTEIRDAAIAAARAENQTVSQWVERLIRDHLSGDRGPHRGAAPGGGRPDLIDLLREVRAMSPEVPPPLVRAVVALARDAVRQARGLPPPVSRQRRLAGPDADSTGSMPADES